MSGDTTEQGSSDDDVEAKYLQSHIEEWVSSLARDHLMSLTMTLQYALVFIQGIKFMDAADCIAALIGNTVSEWRSLFVNNEGNFPDSKQGKYVERGFYETMKN